MCLGLSIQRFESQEEVLETIDSAALQDLDAGTLVRFEWERRMLVGRIIGYESSTQRVEIFVGDQKEKCSIRQIKSIKLAPKGFPEGAYLLDEPTSGVAHSWARQGAPGAVLFGDSKFFTEQTKILIDSPDLKAVLGNASVSLADAMRLDQLTPADLFPHFVNVFERTANFPESDSQALGTLKSCSLCVLSDNAAVEKHFNNSALENLTTIGILDLSVSRYQELALNSVKQSTAYLNAIAPGQLGLHELLPKATQMWAWS